MKVGDIVTVLEGELKNFQGEVIEINQNPRWPIRVKFGPEASHLFNHDDTTKESDFSEKELRVDPAGLTLETRAIRVFGEGKFNALFKRKAPFQPSKTKCQVKGCKEKAILRGLINENGNVMEVDLCSDHQGYHGCLTESFPFKK